MNHHFTFLAALTSVITLSASPSEASTAEVCQIPDNIPLSPSLNVWQETRDLLSPRLENCLDNSDYFALYGASLLYTGNISTAIEMLERALLINPDNGSARIDYALALYQNGQLLGALQVNSELLKEENVPPFLRASLEQRQKTWSKEKHLWRSQFSYLYGHSSNLNNATYIDNYDIKTRFGIINVTNTSPQQSGDYHHSRLMSQYYSLNDQGVSRLTIAAQIRESNSKSNDTDQLSISYEQDSESLYFNQSWSVGINHIRLGDDGLYSALEGNYWIKPRNSLSYLNINTSYTYFNDEDLPGEASLMFEPGVLYTIDHHHFGFNIGLGVNKALNDERSSGDRSIYEASIFYGLPIGKGHFTSRASITGTADNKGYSPALNNNEERITKSWSVSLQYLYPINSNLTLQSSYYYNNQDSNIDIFKMKSESIDLGFSYQF
ncbi:tetratricopeptide repeat protein [Marinomonas gallaica]|uniref:tetratricopeptide repeat protein n=1 Tax=Marinomonas gallaica TaxID=1806667 RepID=UPI003CE53C33